MKREEIIRNHIRGELQVKGEKEDKVFKAMGISRPCWYERLRDPDSFRAGELRILGRYVSQETIDMIVR